MKKNFDTFLKQAVYDWCLANGCTPYVEVHINDSVMIPAHLKNEKTVVLDINPEAIESMVLDDEALSFRASFGGKPYYISIPTGHILKIFCKETGVGFNFELVESKAPVPAHDAKGQSDDGVQDFAEIAGLADSSKRKRSEPRGAFSFEDVKRMAEIKAEEIKQEAEKKSQKTTATRSAAKKTTAGKGATKTGSTTKTASKTASKSGAAKTGKTATKSSGTKSAGAKTTGRTAAKSTTAKSTTAKSTTAKTTRTRKSSKDDSKE